MADAVSTGVPELDRLLEGGYERDIITTVYGPAGSGKTNLCLLCAAAVARSGKKVVYIDTESSFSVERLKQVAADYEKVLDNILILKPSSFAEQKKVFAGLKSQLTAKIGAVIVDTIVMLYRVEQSDAYEKSRDLGLQVSYLSELARTVHIPVLLASQVYSVMGTNEVGMVGGDLLAYASKCIIELQNINGRHCLVLRKHRSLPVRTLDFRIVGSGIAPIPR